MTSDESRTPSHKCSQVAGPTTSRPVPAITVVQNPLLAPPRDGALRLERKTYGHGVRTGEGIQLPVGSGLPFVPKKPLLMTIIKANAAPATATNDAPNSGVITTIAASKNTM